MKKLFLTTLCLILSTGAFAQIQQGNFQLGGSATLNNSETPNFESDFFRILPRFGYFVNDKISLGVQLGYSSNSLETAGGETSNNQFLFGAYARFHKDLAERVYLFVEPSILFGTGDADVPTLNGVTEADFSSTTIGISPGIVYFLTDKIGLEFGFGVFQFIQEKSEGNGVNQTDETVNLSLNPLQINTGLSIYF